MEVSSESEKKGSILSLQKKHFMILMIVFVSVSLLGLGLGLYCGLKRTEPGLTRLNLPVDTKCDYKEYPGI